ncbi:hypothetical protein AVEN_20807-1 [Araneus ventricosus]|uniref:Uncharacterized protein n=1 Tax=Araneus ventricosus TaxID=182803 RepID=A0A4Y2HXV8_ARAVE|nr:hypothetical protein AVEN_20807-1 [Araneus ventricosus]
MKRHDSLRAVLATCHPTHSRDLVACAAARGNAQRTPEESTVNNSDGKRRKTMRLLSNRCFFCFLRPLLPDGWGCVGGRGKGERKKNCEGLSPH